MAHSYAASHRDLAALRNWRTWLLIAAAFLQGGQYVLAPQRPLTTPAYRALRIIGEPGWVGIGAVLLTLAVLLASLPQPQRWPVHAIAMFVYLVLIFATALRGYSPGLLVLAAGLHAGEVRLAGRISHKER